MRTKRIKLYKFLELNIEVQRKVIKAYADSKDIDFGWEYEWEDVESMVYNLDLEYLQDGTLYNES